MSERILVCIAWPYAQSSTHVGQIIGSILPGDVFARYHRLKGDEVLMVSGSDEHGTPITVRADKEGISPREFVARYHARILEIWRRLGISWDLYTETTTENHYRVTQDFFLTLQRKGYIFKDTMESPYCPTDRRFLPDRYVEGTCPYCGYEDARGDQCDNCQRTLDPVQLINPRCKICGSTTSQIEIRATEHFFLDLPQFQKLLEEWLASKDYWRPNTLAFTKSWLAEGLKPRAITRDLDWGVPLPFDGYPDKRIYVWFDAVIGYLSASIEWAERQGQPDRWKDWWVTTPEQPLPSKAWYFIGKDNIPFHTVIWPAMLMGYGNLVLAWDVPAMEYMNMSGRKASTSRGNVVWTSDALDKVGPDPLRYYLLANAPEGRDSDFTYEECIRRNNDELVATYGNAVHRALTFIQSRFEGRVPQPGELREADHAMLDTVREGFAKVGASLEGAHFKNGLNEAMNVARAANRYLDEQAPWKAIKTDPQAAATTLFTMTQVISGLKTLFSPFLPFSSEKLQRTLGLEGQASGGRWEPEEIPAGRALPKPEPLFAKLEEETING